MSGDRKRLFIENFLSKEIPLLSKTEIHQRRNMRWQVLRARPGRPSDSFRGMIYNTHPDGGEDLVGLDVLEPVLLLAFVEQLQVRLEMRRTKGAEWKWRRPRRQMGWIASA